MILLLEDYNKALINTLEVVKDIEGYLTTREIKFLFLLGAYPTTQGEVLEIGSFKGKSTVILAKASRFSGGGKVVAVDPLTSPSVTDPSLRGKESGEEEFQANLEAGGVKDEIEFHRMFSHELAGNWYRKLRLLWIDGDHTYEGTKTDFDLFSKFLSDRAIIAFHDVLSFDGPLRVFKEDILLSNRFGPAGLCGTIGWAQYLSDERECLKYRKENLKLHQKLSRLLPYLSSNEQLYGLRKFKYKLSRLRIPHSEINPAAWINKLILT